MLKHTVLFVPFRCFTYTEWRIKNGTYTHADALRWKRLVSIVQVKGGLLVSLNVTWTQCSTQPIPSLQVCN